MKSMYNSSVVAPSLNTSEGTKWNSSQTAALSMTFDDAIGLLVILAVTVAYLSRGHFWDKKDPLYYLWFQKPQADLEEKTLEGQNRNIAVKLEENVRDKC